MPDRENEPMTLTSSEQIDVILNVIWSLVLVAFIYTALMIIYPQFISFSFPFLSEGSLFLYFWRTYQINIGGNTAYQIITLLFLLIAVFVALHQYQKRVEKIQLEHVLKYVHYFADGHYDKRIPDVDNDQMSTIVESINSLVDSTQNAIEEERRVEKTKDELIANVSHDIRTPLTSTIGYLDAVVNEQYQTEEEKAQYIQIAYNKALTMSILVEDLFLYTDSLQETYQLDYQEIPLDLYLSQLAAEFELEAANKGIDILVEVMPKNTIACFDPDKMARVISNLLSNALKYGYGADLIRLRSFPNPAKDALLIECRNNGRVLEAGEEEKIFERSYRTEKSRNASEPGSGLGLAIVKNMVELHNGFVCAFVDEGETVFQIELPREKER